MIALEVLGSIICGTAIGWYTHKASLRIQAWGVNMNEQDHILEDLTDPEEALEFQRGYIRTAATAGSVASIGSHHLPLRAATK